MLAWRGRLSSEPALNPALRPLWALAAAASRVATALAPNSPGKLARTLRARRGLLAQIRAEAAPVRDPSRPLVWLHAPSVGEGLQARPVLEALRHAHPEWQLAYSWFSPSADAFAARLDVDLRAPLPFDGGHEADSVLNAWAPTVLAFVKLDVWPVLAEQAQTRGVRTALISATLAPNSGRQGAFARALLGDAYAGLDAVGAISAEDATRLRALGVNRERLHVTGDTRMDQVWSRAHGVESSHAVWALLPESEREIPRPPVLVAGSTWPADEAVLLPALSTWLRNTPGARCIIAPHEPTANHLAPIESWARSEGIALARLGDVERGAETGWRVLLVDRIGVLGDLYALATMAFVGGGFHEAGLHSVLEPAAFGVPVLFGPKHRNAREAGELVQTGGAQIVHDATSTCAALETFTHHVAQREEAGRRARALVEAGRGSTERVVALLERLVFEAPLSGAARQASR